MNPENLSLLSQEELQTLSEALPQPEMWVLKMVQTLTAVGATRLSTEVKGRDLFLRAKLSAPLALAPESLLRTDSEPPALRHLRVGLAALARHEVNEAFDLTWSSPVGVCGVAWRDARFWFSPAGGEREIEPWLRLKLTRSSEGLLDRLRRRTPFAPELDLLRIHTPLSPFSVDQEAQGSEGDAADRGSRLASAILTSRTFPSFAFPDRLSCEFTEPGPPTRIAALLEVFVHDGASRPCLVNWYSDGVTMSGKPVDLPNRPVYWSVHLSVQGLETDRSGFFLKRPLPPRLKIALPWTREVLLRLSRSITERCFDDFVSNPQLNTDKSGWRMTLDPTLRQQLSLAEGKDHLAGTSREHPLRERLARVAKLLRERAHDAMDAQQTLA